MSHADNWGKAILGRGCEVPLPRLVREWHRARGAVAQGAMARGAAGERAWGRGPVSLLPL